MIDSVAACCGGDAGTLNLVRTDRASATRRRDCVISAAGASASVSYEGTRPFAVGRSDVTFGAACLSVETRSAVTSVRITAGMQCHLMLRSTRGGGRVVIEMRPVDEVHRHGVWTPKGPSWSADSFCYPLITRISRMDGCSRAGLRPRQKYPG